MGHDVLLTPISTAETYVASVYKLTGWALYCSIRPSYDGNPPNDVIDEQRERHRELLDAYRKRYGPFGWSLSTDT
jgi:hypothetical protein